MKAANFCMHCGANTSGRQSVMCGPCVYPHWRVRNEASRRLFKAVHSGIVPPAKGQKCADCGKDADRYDHRNYSQPLKVEPVCASCNTRRGPAVWGDGYRELLARWVPAGHPALHVAKAVA